MEVECFQTDSDLCPSREQVESQFVDDMFLPLYAETSTIGSHWECRMDPVWCPLEQCNAKQQCTLFVCQLENAIDSSQFVMDCYEKLKRYMKDVRHADPLMSDQVGNYG